MIKVNHFLGRFIKKWCMYILFFLISFGILEGQGLIPFEEYSSNPVYGQHAGNRKAYYPSVVKIGTAYYMWFADGSGKIFRLTSANGIAWTSEAQITFNPALPVGVTPNHPAVVYHPDINYKMYFWDGTTNGLSTMVAESTNGLDWTNPRPITQHPTQYLQGGNYGTYWYHHYGPGQIIYNPGALNMGSNPWDYSYVMTFDTASERNDTGFGVEHCGLAYSDDGNYWLRFGTTPILASANDGNWDSQYIYHGSIIRNGNNWYLWYSGADGIGTNYYAQGIGEAYSNDGLNWTKFPGHNLHFSDGKAWRNERTYAQCVLLDNGQYKMWFSGKDSTQYSLGYAYTEPASITVTSPQGGNIFYSGFSCPITWTSVGSINTVNIDLSIDDGASYGISITIGTPNDGSFTWLIPAGVYSETCKIKISDANGTVFGESNTFVIRNPYISITTPKQGDAYCSGSTQTITWTSVCPPGDARILYSTDNGINYTHITYQKIESGSYDWQIPQGIASTTCKIRIRLVNTSLYDISDVFIIGGNKWLAGQGPGGGIYYGTAYGYSKHIAVGDQGKMAQSIDGINWTPMTSPTTNTLNDIYFNGQYFVAVGENRALYVCNSNGQWTQRQLSIIPAGTGINGITFGNNTWIAVCDPGSSPGIYNIIKGNADTSSWSLVGLPQPVPDLLDVTYGNNLFLAVGKDNTLLYSVDGSNWTIGTLPGSHNDVAYSGSLNLYAAVGNNGSIATSSIGRHTWTNRSSGTTANLQSVLWQGNKFVVVGLGGTILESSNGINWTIVNSGTTNNLYVVGFGGNTWAGLGDNAFLFNLSCN